MTSALPFLMFQGGRCEEALGFYAATVPDSRIVELERFGPGEQGPEGSIKAAFAVVAGLMIRAFDSPVRHGFDFTPSWSFFLECEDAGELDRLAATLGERGEVMMPIGDYGFSRRFAWVADRFGVSWQLNLAREP